LTRLLFLPDDATVVQLTVDLTAAELVSAVNAGMRPLPLLRDSPSTRLTACQVNNTVIIAPSRSRGRPAGPLSRSDLTRRQRQVLELSSRGFDSAEIATMLDLSRRAVNYHLNQVKKRIRGENSPRGAAPLDPTDLE
jgi:DNA-binding CsgD family transcriptional regulator